MDRSNRYLENNILIAEFMGVFPPKSFTGQSVGPIEYIPYHQSWDWLMPVIEKIENCFNGMVLVNISDENCRIEHSLQPEYSISVSTESKIKSTYEAVLEFIKWHNEQQK